MGSITRQEFDARPERSARGSGMLPRSRCRGTRLTICVGPAFPYIILGLERTVGISLNSKP